MSNIIAGHAGFVNDDKMSALKINNFKLATIDTGDLKENHPRSINYCMESERDVMIIKFGMN